MKSLQANLKTIRDILLNVTENVYHYERPPKTVDRYIVWQEDSEADSNTVDNHKVDQQITGSIDFFTSMEFDPLVDAIQAVLDAAEHVGFRLNSVQYEDETKLIHFEWEFWVA